MNLQEHQEAALTYFMSNDAARGMLLFHGTGSGKTLTAIAIAEMFKSYREVVVLAPKSLHDNFRKELKRFTNNNVKSQSRYSYISSNASNMIDKLETTIDPLTGSEIKKLKLENKFIIIDEAHNLLVAMSNGSKGATALYDKLMRAKNCKILFLTASGIVNTFYEVIPCLNICKGYIKTEDGDNVTLFPESYEDFIKYFVDEKNLKLKNQNKLRNRMMGLVSYKGNLFERKVDNFHTSLKETIKQDLYPDRLPIVVSLIRMSNIQYSAYEQAREKERLETRQAIIGSNDNGKIILNRYKGGLERITTNPYLFDPESAINGVFGGELQKASNFSKSTSYRIKSRQLSNIYWPEGTKVDYKNIKEYSPKLFKIGSRLERGRKAIIYSNFVRSGIDPTAEYLEHLGYKRYIPHETTEDSISGYYGIYSGDVKPDDRTATLNEYNDTNSPLTVLLISSSGAEGLSSKGTRDVHILEPYWNWERSLQVMARAIRYKSHEHLPEKDRNVQVYIYLAIAPKDVKTTELSTDMNMFTQAAKKYEMNEQMIKLMASVSVECDKFNRGLNFDCYKCVPRTGVPLYLNDLNKDMEYPSPCKNNKQPVNAKEYSLSGNMYYIGDDHKIYQKNNNSYLELIDPDIIEYIKSKVN